MTDPSSERAAFLLRGNLERIFNERDASLRRAALAELWVEEAVLFESDAIVEGRDAISETVGALLARLPPGTMFRPAGAVVLNHGMALMRWTAAADAAAPDVTGTDLALIEDGRIRTLHVFLDDR